MHIQFSFILPSPLLFYMQVKGAISAIRYTNQFPRLPKDVQISGRRELDMFDLLEYVFGFQVGVCNTFLAVLVILNAITLDWWSVGKSFYRHLICFSSMPFSSNSYSSCRFLYVYLQCI